MAVITDREIAEECRYPTIDLIAVLRARSLRWAGKELRKAPEESLVHQMLVVVADHDLQLGIKRYSILMGAPTCESVESCWQKISLKNENASRKFERRKSV